MELYAIYIQVYKAFLEDQDKKEVEGGGPTAVPPNYSDTQQNDERPSEQDKEQTDRVFVRFPYMACEVICCEISGVIDTIVDGRVPSHLDDPAQDVVSSDASGENAEVTLKNTRPKTVLDLLFSMLYDSEPGEVDDYRAGYFDKDQSEKYRSGLESKFCKGLR